jgi:hypothetical protein
MVRWTWLALLGVLLAGAVVLAWADSTVLRPLFPEPLPPPRRAEIRGGALPVLPLGPAGERRAAIVFPGFGPVGGLFSFWWFLSTAAGVAILGLAALAVFPARARRAAERLAPSTLSLMLVAGFAAVLLGVAVTVLMRATFVLLSFVPLVWAAAALGALFGVSVLALALGRWLRLRLGPAPALVGAVAGLLLFVDVAFVPVLGWAALAALAVCGLGVAVLTRLGSASGWGLEELNW